MTTGLATALPRVEDQDLIDRIIGEQAGRPGALLGILERLQDANRHKYLPMETLEYVALRTGIPQSQVYAVATFYALFNLEPQGTHTVAICRGTACHTRGSRMLLERVKLQLGLEQAADGPTSCPHDAGPQGSPSARSPASASARSPPSWRSTTPSAATSSEQALIREVEQLRKDGAR